MYINKIAQIICWSAVVEFVEEDPPWMLRRLDDWIAGKVARTSPEFAKYWSSMTGPNYHQNLKQNKDMTNPGLSFAF